MAANAFQLKRLVEVCTATHKDAKDPDHRHNALHALKLLLSTPGQTSAESIGNKEHILSELKDLNSFNECLRLVLEIADDAVPHSHNILCAEGKDHERTLEVEVKCNAANLIAPLYFHYYLAGHDSPVVFDYIRRLFATEDRPTSFVQGDSAAKMLLPSQKRGYAQTAFSGIVELFRVHSSNSSYLQASGWGESAPALQKMRERILEALNPAGAGAGASRSNASSLNFLSWISQKQIEKDRTVCNTALQNVLRCLEVPQICMGIRSSALFGVLQPLIAPVGFKPPSETRVLAIQCAVTLAMFGQPDGDFHPWQQIMERTLLVRLQQLPAIALKKIHGDTPKKEFLTEQLHLINGIMLALKVEAKFEARDREVLPEVVVSFFSSTRNLMSLVGCLANLNAFSHVEDFDSESGEDYFSLAVDVVAATCNLLQAVCCRFPLSCTVEETRDAFFRHAESALPFVDGSITETPREVDDGFGDDDEFYDDTPSRSSTVNEDAAISVMYMAAIRLDATLAHHASFQVDDLQRTRLVEIMMRLYRKTTLEFRVKSEVLTCLVRYYNLSSFTKEISEFFIQNVLLWNALDAFDKNVPSAVIAMDFMEKVISSKDTTPEARMPFLDLSFVFVSQVAMRCTGLGNESVKQLMKNNLQFLLHAAPQWTRGPLLKSTIESSAMVDTALTVLKSANANDAANVEVVSLCLKLLKAVLETGAAISLHSRIFEYLISLFASAAAPAASNRLRFSASDFLKSHLGDALALSKSLLVMATPDSQGAACELTTALFEYGRIKEKGIDKIFLAISGVATEKKWAFSQDMGVSIEQRAIDSLSNESGAPLSTMKCIWSIFKFCRECTLNRITPVLLQNCFKKSSLGAVDFEVCSQILSIAALHPQSSDNPQFSEMLAHGIAFLSTDSCDSAFVEALSTLAAAHANAPAIVEKAVADMIAGSQGGLQGLSLDSDGRGSKKMKAASANSIECSLPSFISFVFGHVEPSHALRKSAESIVKRCFQSTGKALIFGMQCLQFIPQQPEQLVSCFSQEADIVLNAFAKMTPDTSQEESDAIHDATSAFLLVLPDVFAPKFFAIVEGDVQAMIKSAAEDATATAAAAAAAFPKFVFFRKALGQWIDRSIVKVEDGEIRWHGGHINRNAVVQKILELCFQVPLSSDGPFAAISTVCVGVLGTGLFLDSKAADGECAVLAFAQQTRSKTQAVIMDAVLSSIQLGNSSARDGMSQILNASIIRMLQLLSVDILPPASIHNPSCSVPELSGSDVNTKLFKSSLLSCIGAVDAMGKDMPLGLFQEIATGCCGFLRRFSTTPTTVEIWRAWEAFNKSAMSWSSVLVKAAIRRDDSDSGYNLRDFTFSLRLLALDLMSKLASAAQFRLLSEDLQKSCIQCIILHMDDLRPEVMDKANQIVSDFFKFPALRALMKQQDMCKALCDELNGIRATLPLFDEVVKAADPKGNSPAEAQLKNKKLFVKAIDPRSLQLQVRKSRIQLTSGIVQALVPQNSLL